MRCSPSKRAVGDGVGRAATRTAYIGSFGLRGVRVPRRVGLMKAISYARYGGPETLAYGEVRDPKVGPDAVLVKVRAAAVNPVDWKCREGYLDPILDAVFPVVPGWDVSGVVVQLGVSVAGVRGRRRGHRLRPRGLPLPRHLRRVRRRPGAHPRPQAAQPHLGGGRGPAAGRAHRLPGARQGAAGEAGRDRSRPRGRGRRRLHRRAARPAPGRPGDRYGERGQPRLRALAGRRARDLRRGAGPNGCAGWPPKAWTRPSTRSAATP